MNTVFWLKFRGRDIPFKVGYWALMRAANEAGKGQVKVLDNAGQPDAAEMERIIWYAIINGYKEMDYAHTVKGMGYMQVLEVPEKPKGNFLKRLFSRQQMFVIRRDEVDLIFDQSMDEIMAAIIGCYPAAEQPAVKKKMTRSV